MNSQRKAAIIHRDGRVEEKPYAPLPLLAEQYCPDEDVDKITAPGELVDCRCWRCWRRHRDNPDKFREECVSTGICRRGV